jgi:hypothetical protein
MNEESEKRLWQKPYFPPPSPSPLENRDCKCGCGNLFTPKRRDQVYLNSQHANYGYNHGIRKKKNKKINISNKQLFLNDNLLGKYHKMHTGNPVTAFLDNLKAGGFDTRYFTRTVENENVIYYYLYNYAYSIYKKDDQYLIKIYK